MSAKVRAVILLAAKLASRCRRSKRDRRLEYMRVRAMLVYRAQTRAGK